MFQELFTFKKRNQHLHLKQSKNRFLFLKIDVLLLLIKRNL